MSRGLVRVGVRDGAARDVPAADLADPEAPDVVAEPPMSSSGGHLRRRTVLDDVAHRSWNRQPAGRAPGRRRAARDPAQGPRLAEVRDRVEQRPGVRDASGGEDLVALAELDDLAGIHHRDPVGDVGDHREVVGDVERGHPVGPAELAPWSRSTMRLGGDVEPGGRLVEHQHLGPRQERHRQCDPLHLAARELVGVAAQELVVVGQPDLGEPVAVPLRAGTAACRCRAAPSAPRSACRSGCSG